MPANPTRRVRFGFTMGQLLVVIFVVSILVGLIIPWVQRMREAAARAEVINNLKRLSLTPRICDDVHRKLPPATGTFGQLSNNMSLSVHLLPYMEQTLFYIPILEGSLFMGESAPTTIVIPQYLASSDFTQSDGQRVQNFGANVRIFTKTGLKTSWNANVLPTGTFLDQYAATLFPKDFPDGTSNTIVFSTRFANNTADRPGSGNINCSAYDAHYLPGSTTPPFGAFFGAKILAGRARALAKGGWLLAPTITQANCAPGELAHSFDRTGILVGMADASVRNLSPTISPTTWNQAMCPNDGNELGSDWEN